MTREKNNKEYQTVVLAALLHDIGKFYQRTWLPAVGFENVPKNDIGDSGAHAKWSASFIKHSPTLKDIECLQDCVLYHHKPATRNDRLDILLLQISDWLSAGERERDEEIDHSLFYKTPLQSVLSRIEIDSPLPDEKYSHPLNKLQLTEKVFPEKEIAVDQNYYKKLWGEENDAGKDTFVEVMKRLKKADIKTIFNILRRFTAFIPSATPSGRSTIIPDISLFDHLKTTAAIAGCLQYQITDATDAWNLRNALSNNNKTNDTQKELIKKPFFFLLGGDLSGIQKFIYNISSKGAAKGLRGRSLYIQLLVDAVVKYIFRELEIEYLSATNTLYCGGGNFYLLLPQKIGDISVPDKLRTIQKEISKKLLAIHGGELYLTLGTTDVSSKDLGNMKFDDKWKEVTTILEANKKRKFAELFDEEKEEAKKEFYKTIFESFGSGGLKKCCQICYNETENQDGEEGIKCNLCQSFERLGGLVANKTHLVETSNIPDIEEMDEWQKMLSKFGSHYHFVTKEETEKYLDEPEAIIYLLNDTDFLKEYQKGETSLGYWFTGKVSPFKADGEIKTYDEMAQDSKGVKRLGALKMDIDNLGEIFTRGLSGRASISRISTLSSMVSFFFEGYANKIIEDEQNYKDKAYITYSGGDDLFIVGAWDIVAEIASNIQAKFKRYVCDNQNITLSAGISVVHKKFPLYQAAEDARLKMDVAKQYLHLQTKKKKNAVTFLDTTVSWEEFDDCKELKNILYEGLEPPDKEKPKLSHGIIKRLSTIYLLYKEHKNILRQKSISGEELENMAKYHKWMWRLVYTIHRYGEENKEHEKVLCKVRDKIIEGGIKYLNLPVRWVEFLTRKEE